MPTTTDTIPPTHTTATSATAEGRPITASDAATRGESRGAARMNSTAPEGGGAGSGAAAYRAQADGAVG